MVRDDREEIDNLPVDEAQQASGDFEKNDGTPGDDTSLPADAELPGTEQSVADDGLGDPAESAQPETTASEPTVPIPPPSGAWPIGLSRNALASAGFPISSDPSPEPLPDEPTPLDAAGEWETPFEPLPLPSSAVLRRPSIDDIRDYVSEATAGTAGEFSPPPQLPPELASKVYPPAVRGAFRKENRRARYLDIEVEVTVANAERLSRIVVENVKHELKAVVNARMMTVEDKLFEFRQTMRTLNRRR